MSETYNGWTNYETWSVNLWIDNNEGSYSYWRERAQDVYDDAEPTYKWETKRDVAVGELADAIQGEIEEYNPLADQADIFSDLLNAALSEVDWREIASHYIDDVANDAEAEDAS